jgi:8-oxo-dGTP diphosphatase
VASEWVGREHRHEALDERAGLQSGPRDLVNRTIETTGYDHFRVAAGRIVVQREVVRAATPGAADLGDHRPSSRRYPERPVVGVGAVIAQAGRVVLIKRRFEPLAGQWSLPGGTLELGETLDAAVAREMLEETGLVVEVGPVIEVFDRILLDPDARVRYHFVLIDYLCRPVAGALRAGSDVADAVWADPPDLGRYRMTGKANAVVERAMQMIRGGSAGA